MYKTGHIPDHPEVVKKRVGLHQAPFGRKLIPASQLPMYTTNRAKLMPASGGPGPTNQQDIGDCEGFAHAEAGTLRLANLGQSKGFISPVRLYTGALRIDSTVQSDGTLSPITDTGTTASSIINAWYTFGAELAANDSMFPATQATLYKNPSDPNSELFLPSVEDLHADSPYRFNGAYFIQSQGTQRVLDLMIALASGFSVTDAIPASGPEFQGYTGGILGSLSGPVDHANHILDYEWLRSAADLQKFVAALSQGATSAATSLALGNGITPNFILHNQNSWGTWGEGDAMSTAPYGLYRANINYANQAEDLCVIDIQSAA